jgi:integrase
MASVWIARRPRKNGGQSYRVMFRLGGRESMPRYGGAFSTMREAKIRRDWIAGELAGRRLPATGPLVQSHAAPTLEQAYEAWRTSRVDVAEATAAYQRSAIRRAKPLFGRRVDSIGASDVAALVGELVAKGRARETVRKTVAVLAMVLDHAGVTPNPARDRVHVRLPRENRAEIQPPSAEHVEAVHRLLAHAYRLPLLVLDVTGMRVGELEALTWGDVDEPRGRWRVSRTVAKTGRARWVNVAPALFAAALELCPRDDRHPDRRVFENVAADRLRTAISRACTAAGVPSSRRTICATGGSVCST